MVSLSGVEYIPSWDKFCMYRRSQIGISQQFKLESNVVEHVNTEEEKQLHRYRNCINEYDKILTNGKNWEYYKKIVNPYELVYTQKRYEYFPESVCFLKPLSRSYFKMIEILDLIGFFKSSSQHIRTAHVCEGPGGFIEALFDEAMKSHKKIQMSIAMTLKSKQHNIPGWKKASLFLKKNRNVRIIYGEDYTGNIMKPENQQYFIDYAIAPDYGGKMDIFTADGGFDFSCDYMKQEQMVFPLLMASTKIGFEVLKKGGVFILKIFDFYHKSTLDLLYFLSYHFEEWTLYKPGMSRPCNPEHYFIGKGFIGCTEEILDVMRLWCNMLDNQQPLESLFKIDCTSESSHKTIVQEQSESKINYQSEFKDIIMKLRENSFKTQSEYLETVFYIIDQQNDDLIKSFLRKNEKYSYNWCMRFRAPIYSHRLSAIEELHTDQLVSSQ
jgi:23S rRNA U2552 (ribose-2'-O)-methylase RlmE/FtsJ